MGVFFVKSGPFLNAVCIMYSISIFYFTFYLFGGTQHIPPCLRACISAPNLNGTEILNLSTKSVVDVR